MLYFKTIRWQNFLSTGNQWTTIDLNKHSTNLILGENGAGKSTLLDAILFSLYGRPYRNINKPKLVNSITRKQCLVEIEFKSKNKEYLIRRGINPAVFEIYCEGELIDQNASVREYQEYLEKYVLKMNHKSFTQIVVIGSANFVPFMQMKVWERRDVIEDLLDIEIFSKMYVILKDKMSKNKEHIQEVKYKIDLLRQKRDLINKHMQDLRSMRDSNQQAKEEKIYSIANLLNTTNQTIDSHRLELEELYERVSLRNKLIKKKTDLDKYTVEIESKMNRASKQITFFEKNKECPTCYQEIDDEFRQENIEIKRKIQGELSAGLDKMKEMYDSIEIGLEQANKIQNQIDEVESKLMAQRTTKKHLTEQIDELKAELDEATNTDLSSYEEELEDVKIDLSERKHEAEHLMDIKENYGVASSLLKDGGIKARIIRQYVPIINKLMNKYLSALEFFVQFELDENFNESIRSRFRDEFTYDSFSEGEKARLDLALLFTWRAVAKLRNSSTTNLLILDEVFDGSLDTDGTGYLLSILSSMGESTNVFVISHKGHNLFDKFENVIEFQKIKNFSQIATKGV